MKLFTPDFASDLTTYIVELDHLRRLQLSPTTHPLVFAQLKRLFHTLESVGSARIEGNTTTFAEYLERRHNDNALSQPDESFKEIRNIESALAYIDRCGTERPIDAMFVRELHQLVVKDLYAGPGGEGDTHAGRYRDFNVRINCPPDHLQVAAHMDDLLNFVNHADPPQYDLVKIAQAHHRFVWIHPFGNGNGRTVRLFTYAMLIRAGFKVDIAGRIVNPTAVFCSNREQYYESLSRADEDTDEGMGQWCSYVLSGLLEEIRKVDRLCDHDYLCRSILIPAIDDARRQGLIAEDVHRVLQLAAGKKTVMSGDLENIYPGMSKTGISRKIKALINGRLLVAERAHGRKYVLCLTRNALIPSIVKMLGTQGFLPDNL